MSTVGSELISELGRRGQLGMYFDYAGYRTLRKVDSLTELAEFVRAKGFNCPSTPADAVSVVDALQCYAVDLGRPMMLALILSDPTGVLGVLIFPVWYLSQLFRGHD